MLSYSMSVKGAPSVFRWYRDYIAGTGAIVCDVWLPRMGKHTCIWFGNHIYVCVWQMEFLLMCCHIGTKFREGHCIFSMPTMFSRHGKWYRQILAKKLKLHVSPWKIHDLCEPLCCSKNGCNQKHFPCFALIFFYAVILLTGNIMFVISYWFWIEDFNSLNSCDIFTL